MKTYPVTVPEMAIVAATRAMAGAGAGLLLGGLLPPETRRAVGWTLLLIGVVTTVPIVWALVGKRDRSEATVRGADGPALEGC